MQGGGSGRYLIHSLPARKKKCPPYYYACRATTRCWAFRALQVGLDSSFRDVVTHHKFCEAVGDVLRFLFPRSFTVKYDAYTKSTVCVLRYSL